MLGTTELVLHTCACTYVCTYVHTYIHTYIHTHTHTHTHVHTYLHLPTYLPTYPPTHPPACQPTHLPAHPPAHHLPTYWPTYLYIYLSFFLVSRKKSSSHKTVLLSCRVWAKSRSSVILNVIYIYIFIPKWFLSVKIIILSFYVSGKTKAMNECFSNLFNCNCTYINVQQ